MLMYCPKCGKPNPENAQSCQSCNAVLTQGSPSAETVTVKTSVLAIVSLVLGIACCFSMYASFVAGRTRVVIRTETLMLVCIVAGLAAIICGFISLIRIGLSAGRLVATGFAAIGVALPSAGFFLLLIMAVLMSSRGGASRMTCGINLSSIGKATLIYANDYDDALPHAGGPGSQWTGSIPNWAAANAFDAYGTTPADLRGTVSISASLYLLVKYSEVIPKVFVCKQDSGTTEFRPDNYGAASRKLTDLWDFGPNPPRHCSYAYHMVYSLHRLTTSSQPGMAIAADRNPWIDSPFAKAKDFSRFKPDIEPHKGTPAKARHGNTFAHQNDGQNVLFLDSHVNFQKRAFCSIDDDNIYTNWNENDKSLGLPPKLGSQPVDELDSLLINDPPRPLEKTSTQ
jgi:hypothetical protein